MKTYEEMRDQNIQDLALRLGMEPATEPTFLPGGDLYKICDTLAKELAVAQESLLAAFAKPENQEGMKLMLMGATSE